MRTTWQKEKKKKKMQTHCVDLPQYLTVGSAGSRSIVHQQYDLKMAALELSRDEFVSGVVRWPYETASTIELIDATDGTS